MAVNTIDIPINVKMSISKETADICVQLINLFLENNHRYFVSTMDRGQVILVSDPLSRDGEDDE